MPTPQTLEKVASVPASTTRGSRWRTAAFFCDFAGLLLLLVAWTSHREGVPATALVMGAAALVVSSISLARSWATSARWVAIVWIAIAVAMLVVAIVEW